MSAPRGPKGEYRSAQPEGTPMSAFRMPGSGIPALARLGAALVLSTALLAACGGGSGAGGQSVVAASGVSHALAVRAPAAVGLQVVELVKVSEVRVSRTGFDFIFKVRVSNPGPTAYKDVVLTLTAAGAGASVIDGAVALGSIGAGASVLAGDTITIRQDRTRPFDPAALVWQIVGTPVTNPVQDFTLAYRAAPADNPLKGFMPYEGTYSFPHSLEWFHMPLKDVQTGYNTFDWTTLDARIAALAARGHQAVFSTYLDYPGSESGVPAFLSHVARNYYDGGAPSYSPDYTNPDLQRAVLNYVAALGARYNNDPRVASINLGLLGFWGEWHTYPYNGWLDVPQFMTQVLDAYQSAFPDKLLTAREPKPALNFDRPRLGFGDGSFAYETLGPIGWHFWPKIVAAGLQDVWKTRAISGEVRPEVQGCIWDVPSCTPDGQGFDLAVSTTHASWMLNHGTFVGNLGAAQLQRATEAAQSLGYTLHVPRASVVLPAVGQPLQGTVSVENRGVAPFYYPWTVQVAVLDEAGTLKTWATNWDLRTVLPGTPSTWAFDLPNPGLAAGTYTLLIGVANPMAGGHPLKFANTTQDQHRNAWLTLGTFTVSP